MFDFSKTQQNVSATTNVSDFKKARIIAYQEVPELKLSVDVRLHVLYDKIIRDRL